MRVVLNKDKEHVDKIKSALKENGMFCPCSLEKSPDTICMCKEFRDQNTPGLCHCGLYEKISE